MFGKWQNSRDAEQQATRRWMVAALLAALLQFPLAAAIVYLIEQSVSDIEFKTMGSQTTLVLEPELPAEATADIDDSIIEEEPEPVERRLFRRLGPLPRPLRGGGRRGLVGDRVHHPGRLPA